MCLICANLLPFIVNSYLAINKLFIFLCFIQRKLNFFQIVLQLTIFQLLTKGKRKIIDIKLFAENNNNSLSKMGEVTYSKLLVQNSVFSFICKELFCACLFECRCSVKIQRSVFLLFFEIRFFVPGLPDHL
jgi:hypothetical protein